MKRFLQKSVMIFALVFFIATLIYVAIDYQSPKSPLLFLALIIISVIGWDCFKKLSYGKKTK